MESRSRINYMIEAITDEELELLEGIEDSLCATEIILVILINF